MRGFLCSLSTLRTCEDVHPFLMGARDWEGLGLCGLMLISRPPMVPIHEGVRLHGNSSGNQVRSLGFEVRRIPGIDDVHALKDRIVRVLQPL